MCEANLTASTWRASVSRAPAVRASRCERPAHRPRAGTSLRSTSPRPLRGPCRRRAAEYAAAPTERHRAPERDCARCAVARRAPAAMRHQPDPPGSSRAMRQPLAGEGAAPRGPRPMSTCRAPRQARAAGRRGSRHCTPGTSGSSWRFGDIQPAAIATHVRTRPMDSRRRSPAACVIIASRRVEVMRGRQRPPLVPDPVAQRDSRRARRPIPASPARSSRRRRGHAPSPARRPHRACAALRPCGVRYAQRSLQSRAIGLAGRESPQP